SATGLDPHTTICGCGSTGSTNTSIVPWLGQRLLAKRTPARSSPAASPWSCSASGGCTDTRRGLPSASAPGAALSHAAPGPPPPPIQPSEIVPSGRMTALAPALAAVAATVRTTVASANGSPLALRVEITSRMSVASSMASDPRQIGLERRQSFEIVGGSEQVDIGQRGLHTARLRAVIAPPDQRIEPDDASAAAAQPPQIG